MLPATHRIHLLRAGHNLQAPWAVLGASPSAADTAEGAIGQPTRAEDWCPRRKSSYSLGTRTGLDVRRKVRVVNWHQH